MIHRSLAAIAVVATLALAGCQSLPFPSPTPTLGGGGSEGGGTSEGSGDGSGDGDNPDGSGTEVDVSEVTGAEAAAGLVDPCSLLTVHEIEAALGVSVLRVVRGAVQSDGSQICAYGMDAQGSTAAAMAGQRSLPNRDLGAVVDALENGTAVVGVLLSAQEEDVDYGGDPSEGDDTPAEIDAQALDLGKGGVAVATPNGGAAVVANEQNLLLTIMDLIAGPARKEALATLATKAYGRLTN